MFDARLYICPRKNEDRKKLPRTPANLDLEIVAEIFVTNR